MQAQVIPYRYGLASTEGKGLICGHHGEANPLASNRAQVLPFGKMKVGDSIYIHKKETLPAKVKLAVSTVKRYNRQLPHPIFGMVDTADMLEIIRIR